MKHLNKVSLRHDNNQTDTFKQLWEENKKGEKFVLETKTYTLSSFIFWDWSLEYNFYLVSSWSTLKDLCTIIWMGVSFINFQTEPQEQLDDAAAGAEFDN